MSCPLKNCPHIAGVCSAQGTCYECNDVSAFCEESVVVKISPCRLNNLAKYLIPLGYADRMLNLSEYFPRLFAIWFLNEMWRRLSSRKTGYASPYNDVASHFLPSVNSSVTSKCSTLRGQRSMHSPQVRQAGSIICSPVQAWRRTSIPIGQLNEQIPHWMQRSDSGTTCPDVSIST